MIHISLEGIIRTEEDRKEVLSQIQKVCDQENLIFEFSQNKGMIYICPNGVIDVEIENYYVTLKTNAALVGAGYYAYVVSLFEKIQQAGKVYLSIDDECFYFENHDFDHVKQFFYDYMATLMDSFSKMNENDEATYAWDNKSYLPISKEMSVITPLGYIHASQLRGLSLQQACESFYIWNEKEKDALFYRNSALVSLWCDCLFEKSLYDDKALAIANSICSALEKAHELDADLALPVDEYQMLIRLLHRENRIFDVQQYPKGDIGYRKNPVFYVYGNWFIYFQGNAVTSFDGHTMILDLKDEDGSVICMRITGYKNHEKMDFAYRYLNSVDALDQVDFESEEIHIKAVLHELHDDNKTLYLQAQCLKENELLMINAECADMSAYQQVLSTLENMQMLVHEKNAVDVRI